MRLLLRFAFAFVASGIVASATPESRNDSPFAFHQFSALPFSQLKAGLEQAGWPAAHVEAFVGAEIQRRINPSFEPKPADLRRFEFWRTGPDAEPFPSADLRKREVEAERRSTEAAETFDALFPPDKNLGHPVLSAWNDEREWGALTGDKRRSVIAVLANAERERDAIMQPRGGILSRDEWPKVWNITESARSQIERILNPDELLDFDLRQSKTANRMRRELDNFQPTRDEFIAIFRLRHPLELAFDYKAPAMDAEVDRARRAAEAEVEKRIAAALGPERYDDYQLSLQPACQLLQFDGRFAQVPAADIRALYRELLKTKAHLAGIDVSTKSDADKQAARQHAKTEIHRRFIARLDEEGARRYLQEQGLWP